MASERGGRSGSAAAGSVASALDDSGRPAPLIAVVGDDEFLISRVVSDLRSAALAQDPELEVIDRDAAGLDPVDLIQALSPSLFGGGRLVILRAAQDLPAGQQPQILPLLTTADASTTVVVQHLGGAKGKAVLEAVRKAGAAEVGTAKLTRPDERQQFLRSEVRRYHGTITPDGAAALMEAVGSDLREISAVVAQLVGDTGGAIDAQAVAAYHRGRAEVTGFAVADQAVLGDVPAALSNLRWALTIGVPQVVIADAIADGVRSVARVLAAGPGDPFKLAPRLGMPPWKVKRARSQARGWTDSSLAEALGIVARLNAEVKGVAVDADYALESAIRRIATTKAAGTRR